MKISKKICLLVLCFVLGLALILTTYFVAKRGNIKREYNEKYATEYVILKQTLTKVKKGYMIETIYLQKNAECVYIKKAFYSNEDKKFYVVLR